MFNLRNLERGPRGVYSQLDKEPKNTCRLWSAFAEDIDSKRFAMFRRRNLDLEVKDHTGRTAQVDDDQMETMFKSTVCHTAQNIVEIFYLSHLIC